MTDAQLWGVWGTIERDEKTGGVRPPPELSRPPAVSDHAAHRRRMYLLGIPREKWQETWEADERERAGRQRDG